MRASRGSGCPTPCREAKSAGIAQRFGNIPLPSVSPQPDDPDAVIRELLEKYGALIRRVVARVGGRAIHDSREDVAQAVVMSLWQQVSREQTITHPSSYIYRAAIRETVRAVKQELERMRTHAAIDADDGPALPSTTPDPESAAAASQLGAQIDRAIGSLLDDRSKAVRAHLAGYSVEEIMQAFDWPYQKARNLIARGMADLREELRKGGYGG
jgi:RNA polymerase sigma factor (sigma-70 family)